MLSVSGPEPCSGKGIGNHVHTEERQPKRRDDGANTKLLCQALLAGHIEGARDVNYEIENAHLASDHEFPALWPIEWVLKQH